MIRFVKVIIADVASFPLMERHNFSCQFDIKNPTLSPRESRLYRLNFGIFKRTLWDCSIERSGLFQLNFLGFFDRTVGIRGFLRLSFLRTKGAQVSCKTTPGFASLLFFFSGHKIVIGNGQLVSVRLA